MSNVTVFVGLDYHKVSVQVCVMDSSGAVLMNRPCPNDSHEIIQAVSCWGDYVQAAIEACTGSADLAEELIRLGGWSVDLAHPGYVARIKQSPDKTDFSDARLLADLERVGYLPKVWLAPLQVRELRQLVRYRQQLVNERRNIKLRIGALLREQRIEATGRRWTKSWVRWLKTFEGLTEQSRWIIDQHLLRIEELLRQIRLTEQRLELFMQDDPLLEKLLTLKGVGLVTAMTLRAEIGRFDRFRSGKQLSRFCGLSPRNASSGQRQADAGLIKAGNPQLRAVIIQAVHSLKRHDPRWSKLRLQLLNRGKPRNVVTAAIANRWVRWLFHQMRPLAA